jgi:uncharacterized protein
MLPVIQQIAREYKASLRRHYGEELAELVLFGSHARGDYHSESDVDFAVILNKPNASTPSEMHITSPVSVDLELKYGFPVSTLHVSTTKKQTSMQGVFQDIRKEGIVI